MPKFAGIRRKTIEKTQTKKKPTRVKKPAIPESVKARLTKGANNLRDWKIQLQKMKLGTSLLEGNSQR